MDVKAHHRMIITTAVIAALVAVMATPAQAHFVDVEGGGSGISATTPTIDPNTIPSLNDSVGVATVVGDGSPDAIDRYVANHQATTLTLGGSPDAVDRYLGKGTVVTAQAGSSDSWFDRTWLGLGAGFSALLAAGMAGVFFSARHRGRVALP